jgi:FixH
MTTITSKPPLPWHFIIPALVVAVGILPSFALIAAARELRVAKSDLQPYASSAQVDSDAAIKAHLAESGFHFAVTLAGQRVVAAISGPTTINDLRLDLYRPADAGADQSLAWSDPHQPLTADLSQPGRWRVRLSGTVAGVHARLADIPVDTAPGTH